jgi:hypothetical protein
MVLQFKEDPEYPATMLWGDGKHFVDGGRVEVAFSNIDFPIVHTVSGNSNSHSKGITQTNARRSTRSGEAGNR